MKVLISKSSGIEEFIDYEIGINKNFISSFLKRVGLKEMDLILILLGDKVEVDAEVVAKIDAEMKEHSFKRPNPQAIFFD